MTEEEQSARRTSMGEVFSRVHKVEAEVAEIREQLAGIMVNLQGQGTTLSRIAVTLEQRNATDWKALAAWASVILAIVGLVTSLILTPMRAQLQSMTDAMQRINDDRIAETRNQLAAAEQRGRYMERVERLDAELQLLRPRQ